MKYILNQDELDHYQELIKEDTADRSRLEIVKENAGMKLALIVDRISNMLADHKSKNELCFTNCNQCRRLNWLRDYIVDEIVANDLEADAITLSNWSKVLLSGAADKSKKQFGADSPVTQHIENLLSIEQATDLGHSIMSRMSCADFMKDDEMLFVDPKRPERAGKIKLGTDTNEFTKVPTKTEPIKSPYASFSEAVKTAREERDMVCTTCRIPFRVSKFAVRGHAPVIFLANKIWHSSCMDLTETNRHIDEGHSLMFDRGLLIPAEHARLFEESPSSLVRESILSGAPDMQYKSIPWEPTTMHNVKDVPTESTLGGTEDGMVCLTCGTTTFPRNRFKQAGYDWHVTCADMDRIDGLEQGEHGIGYCPGRCDKFASSKISQSGTNEPVIRIDTDQK